MSRPDRAHVVEHDRFDRAVWDRVADAAGLVALGRQGARWMPGWPALVGDLFFAFYKGDARLKDRDTVPPSARLGHTLMGQVMSGRGFAHTRQRTMLDEVASARAARRVARQTLDLIRREHLLLDDEVLDAHHTRAAEEALAELEHERETLEAMTDEAALDADDPGPSRLARRMLEVEMDTEIELRRQALDAATKRAEAVADDLPRPMMRRLRDEVSALPAELMALDAEVEQFGREIGGMGRLDAGQRMALGDQLARSEKLRKLSALVGAFRRMAKVRRQRRIPQRGPEVYAVERGADPARLLAGELSALRHPLLRKDVRRRFVERGLLQYGLRDEDDRGRGPIVACIDCSGSMRGPRELWAKAVALTLVDQARRQGRALRAIVFDAGPSPTRFDLVEPRPLGGGRRPPDLEAVVAFAEAFPGGGTDFAPPLDAALAALDESRYRKGDVVFITDGEADLAPAFRQRFAERKARLGFRVVGVLVDVAGRVGDATLSAIADEVHRVRDLCADAALEIVERVA